jgi:Apea-like HEPN
LDRFIEEIVYAVGNKFNLKLIDEEIHEIVIKFLRDVYQEPFKSSAEVELVGVVIEPESIKWDLYDLTITLRQTKIEDLQKKQLIYPYIDSLTRRRVNLPSAMMNIESYSVTEPCILQDEIEKIVVMFSLFKVSSAAYISYTMDSEAILWSRKMGGKISRNNHINILETFKVARENGPDFFDFQRSIYNILPKSLYMRSHEKDMIHLVIAYRHYSEALLNTVRIEEKITNAVIGLESLLLAENQEISFRFCIRGAKILSLLNFESLRVKNLLKIAYDIRSTLVHGDDIELDKKVRRLSENPQETNLFLIDLLNYLRTLIVAMIFLSKNNDFIKISKGTGTKNFDKKKFLDIVDNSLISMESEEQLRKLLTFK